MPQPFAEHSPHPTKAVREMVFLSLLLGALYCGVHLLNGWALHIIEFSEHINLIYLPGFLRLANVLLLGLFWGTAATTAGGLMLMYWSHDTFYVALANVGTSATCALISVLLMRLLQGRRVALSRLSDLVSLAFLYALVNALTHHLLWSWLDPSQLIEAVQLLYMMAGDVNGVILGGLFLRWISGKKDLVRKLRTRHDD